MCSVFGSTSVVCVVLGRFVMARLSSYCLALIHKIDVHGSGRYYYIIISTYGVLFLHS